MSFNNLRAEQLMSETVAKVKRGRPRKEDIKKAKAPLGRPKNDTGRIAEFKQRLLGTAGDKVIQKIIEIGQTDGHPGQMAALKMAVDRVLPLSLFEKDKNGSRNAVTINITGIGEASVEQADVVDVDVTDVDYDES